jgi:hypothetical protein
LITTPLTVNVPPSRPTGVQKQRTSPRGTNVTSPRGGSAVLVPITQHQEVFTTQLSGITQTNTPTGVDWTPWGTEQQDEQEEKTTTPRKKITIEELLNKR